MLCSERFVIYVKTHYCPLIQYAYRNTIILASSVIKVPILTNKSYGKIALYSRIKNCRRMLLKTKKTQM